MAKKRGLSAKRGLDALLAKVDIEKKVIAQPEAFVGDNKPQGKPQHAEAQKTEAKKSVIKPQADIVQSSGEQVALIQIAIDKLQPGKYQPRRQMNAEALNELAASIKQHGVMQPIVIRPLLSDEDKSNPAASHEIIAGERRWRAARLAGLTSIPAIERVLDDEITIALALIENIQREDLSVLEQAQALERFHSEFGMSHAMIASVVGKARATVTNLLRLNHLHDTVKAHLQAGEIDMGHARALLSLPNAQQPLIAKKIVDGQMTVRDTERLVKSILNPEPKATKAADHELLSLSQKISDALGATVKLKQGKDGKGSIEIFFYNDDEFSELIERLSVQ